MNVGIHQYYDPFLLFLWFRITLDIQNGRYVCTDKDRRLSLFFLYLFRLFLSIFIFIFIFIYDIERRRPSTKWHRTYTIRNVGSVWLMTSVCYIYLDYKIYEAQHTKMIERTSWRWTRNSEAKSIPMKLSKRTNEAHDFNLTSFIQSTAKGKQQIYPISLARVVLICPFRKHKYRANYLNHILYVRRMCTWTAIELIFSWNQYIQPTFRMFVMQNDPWISQCLSASVPQWLSVCTLYCFRYLALYSFVITTVVSFLEIK